MKSVIFLVFKLFFILNVFSQKQLIVPKGKYIGFANSKCCNLGVNFTDTGLVEFKKHSGLDSIIYYKYVLTVNDTIATLDIVPQFNRFNVKLNHSRCDTFTLKYKIDIEIDYYRKILLYGNIYFHEQYQSIKDTFNETEVKNNKSLYILPGVRLDNHFFCRAKISSDKLILWDGCQRIVMYLD